MKVLLVNPPLIPISELSPPIGLCTLAVWIKNLHEVRILDLDLELKNNTGDPRAFIKSFLIETIEIFKPDVIGFTSMYNNSLQAEKLIQIAKENYPNLTTIAGGPHFGAQGKESLNRIKELDFVIEGEGEISLSLLLEYLERKISIAEVPNLFYRENGNIRTNSKAPLIDMTLVPPIWRELNTIIDLSRYRNTIVGEGRKAVYIEAGRGCPFKCTFCAPAQFWDRKYRVKTISTITDEIQYLYENYGYDSFLLVHDLFTVDKSFVKEFSEVLIEKNLPIEWMANARIDLDLNEILPLMKESGCWKLFYGVESASSRIQHKIKKKLKKNEIISTISKNSDFGIDATCSFVIGFDDETTQELSETISLGAQLKLLGAETVQYHRLRFFPPAPLSLSGNKMAFDMETLKLEFPFQNILDEEVADIKASESFYSGYFAPVSLSGLASELSQIELFFQQAVSIVPITMNALSSMAGSNLVEFFYESLANLGNIDRYSIDWVSNDMINHWNTIQPYIKFITAKVCDGNVHLDTIITSIIEYEEIRLNIIIGNNWKYDKSIDTGNNYMIFTSSIDIFTTIDNLKKGLRVSDMELSNTNVLFIKSLNGDLVAFQGNLVTEVSS